MNLLDICVILCGGKSSRMGYNKALLQFGNTSLITYQYIKLNKIFNNVFISLKNNMIDNILTTIENDIFNINKKIKDNFSQTLLNHIIEDKYNINHPLQGIISSLEKIKKDIFIISIDCPFIESNTIKSISNALSIYDVSYAITKERIHPLASKWKYSSLTKIKNFFNKKNIRIIDMLKLIESKSVLCDSNELLNINTKSDYKLALKIKDLNNN